MSNIMRRNVCKLLLSIIVLITVQLISPVGLYAQDETIPDLSMTEQHTSIKWWQPLRISYSSGLNRSDDGLFGLSRLSPKQSNSSSEVLSGIHFDIDVTYNIYNFNNWNVYTGVGFSIFNCVFKKGYIYLREEGSIGTFVYSDNSTYIANSELKTPADFGLGYGSWASLFNTLYVTFPISARYNLNKVEFGCTLLPSVRINDVSLRRGIFDTFCGEELRLYESRDNRLEKYINEFGVQVKFDILFNDTIGVYVGFNTISLTKSMSQNIYPCFVGVQGNFLFNNR